MVWESVRNYLEKGFKKKRYCCSKIPEGERDLEKEVLMERLQLLPAISL